MLARQACHVFGINFGFSGGQAVFELGQLHGADAPCTDANGRRLAHGVAGLAGQVPLRRVAEFGKAAGAGQVGAHGQRCAAGGYGYAVQVDLGFEVNQVARQAGGQFTGQYRAAIGMGFGQVAGDQVGVGLGGGDVAEGEAASSAMTWFMATNMAAAGVFIA